MKPLTGHKLEKALEGLHFWFTWEFPEDYNGFCRRRQELGLCGDCNNRLHGERFDDLVRQGRALPIELVDKLPLKHDATLIELFLLCFKATTNNKCYDRAQTLAKLWLHYGITDDFWVMNGTVRFYNSECIPHEDPPPTQNRIIVNNRPSQALAHTNDARGATNGIHHGWVERRINGRVWCYDTTNGHRIAKEDYYHLYDIRDAQLSRTPDNLRKQLGKWQKYGRKQVMSLLGFLLVAMDTARFPFGALYGEFGWEVLQAIWEYLRFGEKQQKLFLSDEFMQMSRDWLRRQIQGGGKCLYKQVFSGQYADILEGEARKKFDLGSG